MESRTNILHALANNQTTQMLIWAEAEGSNQHFLFVFLLFFVTAFSRSVSFYDIRLSALYIGFPAREKNKF